MYERTQLRQDTFCTHIVFLCTPWLAFICYFILLIQRSVYSYVAEAIDFVILLRRS